jgi:N-formylglutamate amidohydrolase
MMVDELFRPVVGCGAPLLRAVYPRAFLDVNREPFELDPKMFSGRLPPFANSQSLRVAGGLGTIPKVVSDTASIYRAPWPVDHALQRIDAVYRPYHDALRRLLAETHVAFGSAILIDCHSMPSTLRNGESGLRPDFVLGDRFGTSCMPVLAERVTASLRSLGYSVCRNKPYAGGFITEHYGRPRRGLHALQIEVNRALYMDEEKLELHSGFEKLRQNLAILAGTMIDLATQFAADLRDAAE